MEDSTLIQVVDLIEKHGYFPISFGLAPNPNGFCYENAYAGADYDNPMSVETEKKFNLLLDSLTAMEEQELIKAYL